MTMYCELSVVENQVDVIVHRDGLGLSDPCVEAKWEVCTLPGPEVPWAPLTTQDQALCLAWGSDVLPILDILIEEEDSSIGGIVFLVVDGEGNTQRRVASPDSKVEMSAKTLDWLEGQSERFAELARRHF